MKRKHGRRGIACAAILLVALTTGACTGGDAPKTGSPESAKVGTAGGTVNLNGVTVTVPPGAVQSDTEMLVSTPARVPGADAPFKLNTSTRVDISFKDGAQPAPGKPLDVAIPLKDGFRPDGTSIFMALLYHRLPDGKGFRLVPATVKDDTLHAQLPHLSEWDVVYLDDATLNQAFGYEKLPAVSRDKCATEITAKSTGKIKFGSGNKGWSSSGDSPVSACLVTDGNNATLSIANKVNYPPGFARKSAWTDAGLINKGKWIRGRRPGGRCPVFNWGYFSS